MSDPRKQNVVITGAGSGIGRELAVQFAARGAGLALVDVDRPGLAETLSLVRSAGACQAMGMIVDVTDEAQVNAFAHAAITELGSVDVLINNAGITRFGEFSATSLDAFRRVMDVNFWGVVHCSRAFLPALRLSRGSLVNLSSLFGLVGVFAQSHYCASKFAVRGFTEALRQEVEADGVHVACVHPGGVRTNIASSATFDQAPELKADLVRQFERTALKMPPAKAARLIIEGIDRRRERILVGHDAKVVDLLQRWLPASYAKVLKRLLPKPADLRKRATA